MQDLRSQTLAKFAERRHLYGRLGYSWAAIGTKPD